MGLVKFWLNERLDITCKLGIMVEGLKRVAFRERTYGSVDEVAMCRARTAA